MLRALVLVSILAVPQSLPAQWLDRSPSNPLQTPSPRAYPAMCWDAAHGYVLLCGGQTDIYGFGSPNETWSWDGTTWTRRPTTTPGITHQPDAPTTLAMAFHPPSNQAVLLWSSATLLWNGTDWLQHPSSLPIPPVYGGIACNVAMAHDPVSGQLVAYVGSLWQGSQNFFNVSFTFTWDGTAWTRRMTAFSPWPVQQPTMAFDPVANRLVLGTQGTTGSAFFEWTGTNWQQRLPASVPTAVGAFATDIAANRLVMFDGALALQPGHTWTLANGTTQQLVPPLEPGPRFGAAMAYDPVRQRVVLFGGTSHWDPSQAVTTIYLGDTWELQLPGGGSYTPFGSGCVGSHGTPTLAASFGQVPRVGQPFQAVVTGLPLTGPAFLFVGLSNANYGPTPLPLSLGVLGAPGCTLYCSGDDLAVIPNVLGTGLWQWTVPNAPGVTFYNQAFAFDAAANPLGLTSSNGATGLIGF